jgi:hypothetical protein
MAVRPVLAFRGAESAGIDRVTDESTRSSAKRLSPKTQDSRLRPPQRREWARTEVLTRDSSDDRLLPLGEDRSLLARLQFRKARPAPACSHDEFSRVSRCASNSHSSLGPDEIRPRYHLTTPWGGCLWCGSARACFDPTMISADGPGPDLNCEPPRKGHRDQVWSVAHLGLCAVMPWRHAQVL